MSSSQTTLEELLRKGLRLPNPGRIEHALGERGVAGEGGILAEVVGWLTENRVMEPALQPTSQAAPPAAAQVWQRLQELARSTPADPHGRATGRLETLAAALSRGGGLAVGGGRAGGATALLGLLALQAFRHAGSTKVINRSAQLTAGLREPGNAGEASWIESLAALTVRAMINAAKADGEIDAAELQRISDQLDSLDPHHRQALLHALQEPMETDAIVQAVSDEQVAAQVYAASLLATGNDTVARRNYLAELAFKLDLDGRVTDFLHNALGPTLG
jgi:uncharacterized membrane protein YebE (DUF533 family)